MEHLEQCKQTLTNSIPDLLVQVNEPMRKHTTFAIGGPADLLIQPDSIEQLTQVLRTLQAFEIPLLIVGNGSNLLVRDKGVRGAVVCLRRMHALTVEGTTIKAQAGASLAAVAAAAQRAGLTGAEFAGGIPGSVGGAVFMNAGAYDGQMDSIVVQTTYLDQEGCAHTIDRAQHEFGYRTSVFRAHPTWIIVHTTVQLAYGNRDSIAVKMRDLSARRQDKQPLHLPSAGSTFQRPAGHFAGQLIEQAGLKGVRVGNAQVSEKHAGFVVNRGGATCEEVEQLIALIQERVYAQSGVTLCCEVRIVGER